MSTRIRASTSSYATVRRRLTSCSPDSGLSHEPLLSLAADAETQKTALNLPRCGHTCIHPASRPARNTHRWAADRYTTEVLAVPRSQ
jgi:hypothetical protein